MGRNKSCIPVILLSLMISTICFAIEDDEAQVKAAFDEFVRAYFERDWRATEQLWSHKDDVLYVPIAILGKPVEGWEAVKVLYKALWDLNIINEINLIDIVVAGNKASIRWEYLYVIGGIVIKIKGISYLRRENGDWRIYMEDHTNSHPPFEPLAVQPILKKYLTTWGRIKKTP